MDLSECEEYVPKKVFEYLEKKGFDRLRPAQSKSLKKGLFEDNNLLVCTPTASGKTLVGELAALNAIIHDKGKAVYLVPLKALVSEKQREFEEDYPGLKIAASSGDLDNSDPYLADYDWIIATSEKFDSLIRHRASWLDRVKTVIIDEIHLLNDPSRGPTLEVVITLLKQELSDVQIVGLSATVGNAEEVADWLGAELVEDDWRPVTLKEGICFENEVEFF